MPRRLEQFEVEDTPLDPEGVYTQRKPYGKKVATEARVMRIFVGILSGIVLIVVVALLATNTGHHENRDASAAAHTGVVFDSGFNMKQNWGSYSPYFDSGVPFDGITRKSQDGDHTHTQTCQLKQVHVLHRHGDRYPTSGVSSRMQKVATRLANATEHGLPENLVWLKRWKYLLGEELLVSGGRGALFESGAEFWGSHGRLLYGEGENKWLPKLNVWPNGTARRPPVLRATTQSRIKESMRSWAAGFFGLDAEINEWYDSVLIPEATGTNNSLASYYSCPNSDKPGAHSDKKRAKIWINTYLADAATRIQKFIPTYGDVSPEEALEMQNLCVFETAAFGASGFCGWFTEQEWRGYEYLADLKFYGDSASGSAVGPTMGYPWLTELWARLAGEHISGPNNGVNVPLDLDDSSFPLHQPFYADFTHDSVIVNVLSALQFSFTKIELPAHKIRVPRQFIVSRLTPFAARLYVEVLDCGEGGNQGEYIRLKLNDRVLPLGELKYCEDSDSGLCTRKAFMKTLEWTLKQTDFVDVCYGEHEYKPYDG